MSNSSAGLTSMSPTRERQLLEDLYRERTLHPYTMGQQIPLYPEEWVIVCRGVVQLSTFYPNGNEAVLGFAGPSMPLGFPLTALNPYQATAMTDVDILRLAASELENSQELARGLVKHLIRRLRQTEALLALSGRRRVEDRLQQLLALLAMELGTSTPEGTRLNVRLTHQNLANAIGTTRVTITRLLNRFREEGWLSSDKQRHLVIHFPEIEKQNKGDR
ncbi:MAG: Crp/Fnr family transcriptional regulator [Synechococcaceae cyanobacterium SM2_3_1]|nr:Crp/Fnr family transcriptional regulator [Synechococcaceae cyanobacterium SM2_3_1]